jgi:predicted PurR-regulated permease PerM
VVIQQVESNLLMPLVMQKATSMHPAMVLASVTAAGAAFVILGALLAVLAAVVCGILVEELWIERLEEDVNTVG